MYDHLDILLIEDNMPNARAIRESLANVTETDVYLRHVQDLRAAKGTLSTRNFDIALVNLALPDSNGLQTVQDLFDAAPDTPIIAITGNKDKNLTARLLRCGAQDYLVNGCIDSESIARTIRHAIERHNLLAQLKKAEKQHTTLANRDLLTDLPNRAWLLQTLNTKIQKCHEHQEKFALLYIDLDRFKFINDSLGYFIGDSLLKIVTRRIVENARVGDIAAHLGGDKFIVVLPDTTAPTATARVASHLLACIAEPYQIDGHACAISASLGIASYPNDGNDVESLLKHAEMALYSAKSCGRGNYMFFTPEMTATAIDRLTMEQDLRQALAKNEFELHFQPQMEGSCGRVAAAEALIRWHHPRLGVVMPAKFIPLAEEAELIIPISEWVLEQACQQNKQWQEAGYPAVRVSVNISAQMLQQTALDATLARILEKTGLEPSLLELEFKECVLMSDCASTLALLRRITNMGVRLSIDDFGNGYSSLSYLKRLPITALKLDKSFLSNVPGNKKDEAIIQGVVSMAKSLEMEIIAEGIETIEQYWFLRTMTCDGLQGYFFHRPVSAPEFTNFLLEYNGRQSITA
jgi:diguanylate cyclase (GGDEF)-like protein